MRIKFGYKTFASKVIPITHPKRPFNKYRDFTPNMHLFVYLTPTGLVSKHYRERTSYVLFHNYTSDGLAYIWIQETNTYKVVNPERIYRKEVA